MTKVESVAIALTHMQCSQKEGEEFAEQQGVSVDEVLKIVSRCPTCGYWTYSDTMVASCCRTCLRMEYDEE
jgi:hypothetical protein